MAPDRKADLADVILRAFVTGSVVTLSTACVAGADTSPSICHFFHNKLA